MSADGDDDSRIGTVPRRRALDLLQGGLDVPLGDLTQSHVEYAGARYGAERMKRMLDPRWL
jgi:hypothetical protein